MKRLRLKTHFVRWAFPAAALFQLGGCGLSDSQLTSVAQSVVTTALNTLVTQGLGLLLAGATGTTA